MAEIRGKGGIALIVFDASPDRCFNFLLRDHLERGSDVPLVVSTSAELLDRIDDWQSMEETLRKLTWVYDGGLTPDS
jgi:hypothetical protein